MDGARVRPLERFGVGVMALLAWGVLTFGAVYPWAYWPLFAGAAALGVWGVRATRGWRDPRIQWLAIALGLVLLAMSVQVVALPAWLIELLSPSVDRFFRRFEVGYHPAALHTLSLAPAETSANIAEVAALGLLLLGVMRGVRFVTVEWLVGQLMGLGVAIATIGILQKALGPTHHVLVYGFWRPLDGGSPFGPFINRNHFAGWMAMLLPVITAYAWVLIARATRPETSGWRAWLRWAGSVEGNRLVLVSSAALIMGVSLVLTQSRSGMTSVAVALVVLGLFIGAQYGARGRAIAAIYLGLVLLGATAWAGTGLVTARFQRAPAEMQGRLSAWRDTVHIVGDFPVFGTGIGGYGRAMLVYQTGSRELMYAEAHNDYLQLVAEGGVLVTIPVVLLVAAVVVIARRRLASGDEDAMTYWIRRGAVAGLVAAGAQSVVEFSLQMPGNAVLFVVIAAVALHRPGSLSYAHRV